MFGVPLVTRGMIVPPCPRNVVSDAGVMMTAIEVRPKIRANPPTGLPLDPDARPVILSSQEMKPKMVKRSIATAPGAAPLKPKPLSAADLKPTIKKSEEV